MKKAIIIVWKWSENEAGIYTSNDKKIKIVGIRHTDEENIDKASLLQKIDTLQSEDYKVLLMLHKKDRLPTLLANEFPNKKEEYSHLIQKKEIYYSYFSGGKSIIYNLLRDKGGLNDDLYLEDSKKINTKGVEAFHAVWNDYTKNLTDDSTAPVDAEHELGHFLDRLTAFSDSLSRRLVGSADLERIKVKKEDAFVFLAQKSKEKNTEDEYNKLEHLWTDLEDNFNNIEIVGQNIHKISVIKKLITLICNGRKRILLIDDAIALIVDDQNQFLKNQRLKNRTNDWISKYNSTYPNQKIDIGTVGRYPTQNNLEEIHDVVLLSMLKHKKNNRTKDGKDKWEFELYGSQNYLQGETQVEMEEFDNQINILINFINFYNPSMIFLDLRFYTQNIKGYDEQTESRKYYGLRILDKLIKKNKHKEFVIVLTSYDKKIIWERFPKSLELDTKVLFTQIHFMDKFEKLTDYIENYEYVDNGTLFDNNEAISLERIKNTLKAKWGRIVFDIEQDTLLSTENVLLYLLYCIRTAERREGLLTIRKIDTKVLSQIQENKNLRNKKDIQKWANYLVETYPTAQWVLSTHFNEALQDLPAEPNFGLQKLLQELQKWEFNSDNQVEWAGKYSEIVETFIILIARLFEASAESVAKKEYLQIIRKVREETYSPKNKADPKTLLTRFSQERSKGAGIEQVLGYFMLEKENTPNLLEAIRNLTNLNNLV